MNPDKLPKYIPTREAATLLEAPTAVLWNEAGRTLSHPVLQSPRRALWLRSEILALKATRESRAALVGG